MQRFFYLDKYGLTFENCCEAEGKLWFFADQFNALCSMDLSSCEVNYIGSIPGEDILTKYLCASIQYFQGKLFLIPRGAECISIYNIKTKEFKTIEVDVPIQYNANPYIKWLKFISSKIVGNSLYMIPRSYPAIVEMDLFTYKRIYHVQWLYDIKSKIMECDSFFWSDCIVKDKELILASSIANMIFSFNTVTKNYSVLYSGETLQGYSGMLMVAKNILLSERRSGKLKLWDLSQNKMTDYGKMPDGFATNKIIGFSSLIQVGNSIFAIPLWANMLLRIIPENIEIQTVKNYDKERGKNEEIAICCAWTKNKKLYCMNNLSKCIDVFDESGTIEKSCHIILADGFCEQIEEKMLSNKISLFGESRIFPIKAYKNYIPLYYIQKIDDKQNMKKKTSIGEDVFKNLNR